MIILFFFINVPSESIMQMNVIETVYLNKIINESCIYIAKFTIICINTN